ncbi:MAG: UvrD-helicase domain-containing protein, partial [Clostridia bacterium]|nr:UvrD-helicase domain-containing protein [Clostridia bacterium]
MVSEEFLNLRREIIAHDFKRMNPMQLKAVFHTDGPLLILAGAGSGKTTVIVNRIANLIKYGKAFNSSQCEGEPTAHDIEVMKAVLAGHDEMYGDIERLMSVDPVKPWQILAITFTNKAAGELKERLKLMLGDPAEEIWASTFHSCCARILRKDGALLGYTPHFTIYDTDDSGKLIKECQKQLNITEQQLAYKSILSEISKAKDKMMTPAEMLKAAGSDIRMQKIAKVYELYQDMLVRADAMDFDDI